METVQSQRPGNSKVSGSGVAMLSEHLRKYLILYTLLSVAIAIPVGYFTRQFTAANTDLFSNLVIFCAILTIYPSMIQLKSEGLSTGLRSWKPIVVSMVYIFAISPLIAFGLAPGLGSNEIESGFIIANIVPASSASLGYVLIVGGSIELATALAIVSMAVAVPMIPLLLSLYGGQASEIPLDPIMMSVVYILVLPFIVGQMTRYLLIRRKGSDFVNRSSRKYLSLATMLSMLALIFVLVDRESSVIIAKPEIVGYLIGYQTCVIVGVLFLSILISRLMHLSYADHQAVAFISVTKNQSIAAAIAVLSLNPVAALAPAVIPMIQPLLAIIYIHLEKRVKKVFEYSPARVSMHGY